MKGRARTPTGKWRRCWCPCWPRPGIGGQALAAGFASAGGFPLRLREQCIGALNLLLTAPGALATEDVAAAQALADAAAIGILQERALRESRELSSQLQYALVSRVAIEQAKGFVSRALGVDMDEAFQRLRRHSQDRNQPVREVAEQVVDGSLAPEDLAPSTR